MYIGAPEENFSSGAFSFYSQNSCFNLIVLWGILGYNSTHKSPVQGNLDKGREK